MIRCVDDIREQVRRETGLSLTDAQIENMLAGQPCTVSDTVRDIVNRQGRKYTEHLLSATMEAGFDLRYPRRAAGRRRIGGEPPPQPQRRAL